MRAAPLCVSTGSTAADRVAGSTARPGRAGTTAGRPDRARKVASTAGDSTAANCSASAACSAAPSSAGCSRPLPSSTKVSEAASARGWTTTEVPATVSVRSDAVAGVATSSATRVTSAAETSGGSSRAGRTTGLPSRR